MGMFDRLIIECPCGQRLEFQSKAGPCTLNEFTIQNVPAIVAGDLEGEHVTCGCGRTTTLTAQVFVQVNVSGP